MRSNEKSTTPERTQTDDSLRAERVKADLALAEKLAAIDETADAVITLARARADRVLAAARAQADRRAAGLRQEPREARVTDVVANERLAADRALTAERADADATLREERGEHVAVFTSERKETDDDLRDERAQSDDAVGARDEFMGLVSHDLRNMLSAMVGFAALIEQRVVDPDATEDVTMHARRIQRTAGRMNRLIGDLVDVASIEAGVLAVTREVGDPRTVVHEAVDTLRGQAAAGGLTLAADTTRAPSRVGFDAARILQVLTNLICNAVKFTPADGSVVVRLEQVGNDAVFAVEDSGIGIAAEHLETIFVRFSQVEKNDRRGVGLGFISKCIVQGHGGRIWAESTRGRGTTVRFALPIQSTH